MPSLAFLNDNEFRQYPFIENGPPEMLFSGGGNVELPEATIVDATFLLGLTAEFDETTDSVYLYEVLRRGTQLLFRFHFDSPLLTGYSLEFCRSIEDGEFATSTASINQILQSSSLMSGCDTSIVEGWLTTGDLAPISLLLADGQWLRRADGEVKLEPARVQSLSHTFVSSINLANQDRTRVPATDCVELSSSSLLDLTSTDTAARSYMVNAACLVGAMRLRAGFNCDIQQDNLGNTITIGGQIGGGLGEPCAEFELFPGEEPPAGSQLLTGGLACDEIVRSINGVVGPDVLFIGGTGVKVVASADEQHTLNIDIDLHGLAVCNPNA